MSDSWKINRSFCDMPLKLVFVDSYLIASQFKASVFSFTFVESAMLVSLE